MIGNYILYLKDWSFLFPYWLWCDMIIVSVGTDYLFFKASKQASYSTMGFNFAITLFWKKSDIPVSKSWFPEMKINHYVINDIYLSWKSQIKIKLLILN